MTVPAIKQFENRPPAGGWAIDYTLGGQKWHCSGGWRQVTKQIRSIQRANGQYVGEDAIFAYCNEIWCGRSPERCMNPAERTVVQKAAGCKSCGRSRVR